MESHGEITLTGETEKKQEKNLSQCHFIRDKSHMN
jgi:hypothetical protein